MEEQVSLPNVSIPCHDEQREGKRKRFTVRAPAGSRSPTVDGCCVHAYSDGFLFFFLHPIGLQSDRQRQTAGMVRLQALRRVRQAVQRGERLPPVGQSRRWVLQNHCSPALDPRCCFRFLFFFSFFFRERSYGNSFPP